MLSWVTGFNNIYYTAWGEEIWNLSAVYLIIDLLLSSIGTEPDRSQKVTSAEMSCLREHHWHWVSHEARAFLCLTAGVSYGMDSWLSIMGRHESRSADGLENGFIRHDLNALHKRHTFQFICCLRVAMSIVAYRRSRFNALTVYRKSFYALFTWSYRYVVIRSRSSCFAAVCMIMVVSYE